MLGWNQRLAAAAGYVVGVGPVQLWLFCFLVLGWCMNSGLWICIDLRASNWRLLEASNSLLSSSAGCSSIITSVLVLVLFSWCLAMCCNVCGWPAAHALLVLAKSLVL